MRIAYIALYQGPDLLKSRPSLFNLSLGCKVKVELIAELLRKSSHEIEIFSPGPVDQFQFKFYPSVYESQRFHPDIPIYYASALPVRFLTGLWEGWSAKKLLKSRHKVAPFDLIIIQTLKRAQLACADHAMRKLGLPVIFEYEDDQFVDVQGKAADGFLQKSHRNRYAAMLGRVSGCMAVSPHLLSQLPATTPKLLLRGVVGEAIVEAGRQPNSARNNWVVFSGTHEWSQGLEQMIQAWQTLQLPDWELHIAGKGPLTATLQKLAENNRSIVFHGFLNREENARLLCASKIGMNPQDVTQIPGTSFAFKIIEYLAAGLHVITTPRGILEPELEAAVTYISDNSSETITSCLRNVIGELLLENKAAAATLKVYGPEAMTQALNRLLEQVMERSQRRRTMGMNAADEPAASNP
jgi:glycosyltransferase involved in cell wall biosynthesis